MKMLGPSPVDGFSAGGRCFHFVFQYIGSDRGEIRLVCESKIGLGKIHLVDDREGKHRVEISKYGPRLARLGAKYALLADERSDPRQLLVVEL